MSGEAYTPMAEQVRAYYALAHEIAGVCAPWRDPGAEFDRWLEAELARAWDEGAANERDYQWRREEADAAGQGVMISRKPNPYRKEER